MQPLELGQHFDAYHLDAPPISKGSAVVAAGHGSLRVVIDKFTENAGRRLASQQAQVHAALGVSLPCEDAAFARAQGNHVAWS